MAHRLAQRVLLIGWDAADWQFIRPLLDAGQMPTLARLIESGMMGNITTLRPILSPILWNSIATGKRADKHDILGFTEPDGSGGIRPVASTSRKAKALWNILSQNGLRSLVVHWFASHPAEPVRGVIATDRYAKVPLGDSPDAMDPRAVHPPEMAETLAGLRVPLDEITPEQLLPFIPRAAEIDQNADRRLWQFAGALAETSTVHNAATYLIEHEKWDFCAVYYNAIDVVGHGFMPFHPPRPAGVNEADFEMYRHVMTGVYRFHDLMLARLLELAGPETTVVLLSDHGFHSGSMRPIDPARDELKRPKIEEKENPVAWHRPQGIFVAAGPGIKRDEIAYGVSLLDIAPTVLHMLGMPVPHDMDGKALAHLYADPTPVEFTDTYEPPADDDGVLRGTQADDPYSAQEALRQLVELGYIAAPDDDAEKTLAATLQDRKSNLAQVYLDAGRAEDSLAVMREVCDADSTPFTRCRLAMTLMSLGRMRDAEEQVAWAIAREPDMPLAVMLLGEIKMHRREFDEAFRLLDQARAANPRLPYLHTHIGRIHLRKKQFVEAGAAFAQALAIDDQHAEAHEGMGRALSGQGKHEDALLELMKAVALDHHVATAHLAMGDSLTLLKRFDWATRAYEVAASVDPSLPLPHRRLARLAFTVRGQTEAARAHIDTARRLRKAQRERRQSKPAAADSISG